MVKLSPTVANQIMVSWAADYGRGYAMTVALVHKLTSSDLLQRLHKKGAKHADHTRALSKFLSTIHLHNTSGIFGYFSQRKTE